MRALILLVPLLAACAKSEPPKPVTTPAAKPDPEPVVETGIGATKTSFAVHQGELGIQLAVGYGPDLRLYSISGEDEDLLRPTSLRLDNYKPITRLVYSRQGDLAAAEEALSDDVSVYILHEDRLTSVVSGIVDLAEVQFSADGKTLLIADGTGYGEWRKIAIPRGKVLVDRKSNDPWQRHAELVQGAEGKALVIRTEATYDGSRKESVALWDAVRDRPWKGPEAKALQPADNPFMLGGKLYTVRGKQVLDLATGQAVAPEKLRAIKPGIVFWASQLPFDRSSFTVRDWAAGGPKYKLTSRTKLFGQARCYVGRHALVNFGDGIEIFDLRTGKLALQIATALDPQGSWLIALPDGTYVGSEGSEKLWPTKLGPRNPAKVYATLADVLDTKEPGEPIKPFTP